MFDNSRMTDLKTSSFFCIYFPNYFIPLYLFVELNFTCCTLLVFIDIFPANIIKMLNNIFIFFYYSSNFNRNQHTSHLRGGITKTCVGINFIPRKLF